MVIVFMYIDSLWAIAELTLVVVGFSGIVAALGNRGTGNWTGEDISRMSVMIVTAFRTLLAALLPIVFIHFEMPDDAVWAWSSGIFGVFGIALTVVMLRIARRVKRDQHHSSIVQFSAIALSIIGIGINLLNAAGIVFDRSFGAYFLTLVLGFSVTCMYFIRMIQTELLSGDLAALERD